MLAVEGNQLAARRRMIVVELCSVRTGAAAAESGEVRLVPVALIATVVPRMPGVSGDGVVVAAVEVAPVPERSTVV